MMGTLQKNIARTIAVAGVAAGIGFAAPPAAWAGGCPSDSWWECGKVTNGSSIDVYVTTEWGTSDSGRWDAAFIARPGDQVGGYGVDIDGFYVGDCGLYTDYGYLPANSGWWKVRNWTHIDIHGSWC